jgi:hypothetical protein
MPPDDADLFAVNALLNTAVQAEPDLGVLHRIDETAWLIEPAGREHWLLEWAPSPPRLVLTTALGQPAPGQELLTCQTALAYNAQWHQNAGVRMARNPDGGDLLLIAEWHLACADDESLVDALTRFHGVCALWSLALKSLGEGIAPPPQDAAWLTSAERA